MQRNAIAVDDQHAVVFPFDFGGYELGGVVLLTRGVLVVAIVGTVIGLLVNFGLLRHTLGKREGE